MAKQFVYVTKYALTRGIIVAEADLDKDATRSSVVIRRPWGPALHFHKGEWFDTLDAAQDRVKKVFERERKRLQRALDNLDAKLTGALTIVPLVMD